MSLQALEHISHLIIAENEHKIPIAFMGVEQQKLEMLFVSSEDIGKGLGKRLLQYRIKHYSINELTVNEQNISAKGFYEHMGFRTYKRTDYDEQGNPSTVIYETKRLSLRNVKKFILFFVSVLYLIAIYLGIDYESYIDT